MRLRLRVTLIGCAAIAACSTSEWTLDLPTPTPTETPTPTPTATPEIYFGDGADGAFALGGAGTTLPSACVIVAAATGQTLTLAAPGVITAGDHLLVHQVQDDLAYDFDDGSPIIDPRSAGRWDLARAIDVTGVTVTLASALTASYATVYPDLQAQACTMRRYTDVTLTDDASLAAEYWNGDVAGVVAIYVDGTLSLSSNAAVTATGRGFRGGNPHVGNDVCNVLVASSNDINDGGGKGEGLEGSTFNALYGRGNLNSAGGGGNSQEAGGGGGGNGGTGGAGGYQNDFMGGCGSSSTGTQGRGGSRVAVTDPPRFTFGGGGGAGDGSTTYTGSSGGRGGGLVLVVARHITGSGKLRSEGLDAGYSGGSGGGGGAGGTIVVMTYDDSFAGSFSVAGGAGGNSNGANGTRGPGGGGGGGQIFRIGVVGAAPTIEIIGGPNGTTSSMAYGASPGQVGIVVP